ncbi:hypothetical protein RM863_35400 [Streptomyces sp. DSM 41014]|uniref:Uncharacterized protein n=1 Tax=Streptomyces hintoniae TaxID=3075521 RepID=A0ABU2UVU9_9ACTN|nr:hypothetical protein [Streptomyces sp. DSM 41014]MDT0477422.1 hypothetical protein [Streptomyces sp. DSM 41014]
MSPHPSAPADPRPAADWNAAIRVLARAAWGRPFTDAERAEYQVLLAGWAAADRAESGAAA